MLLACDYWNTIQAAGRRCRIAWTGAGCLSITIMNCLPKYYTVLVHSNNSTIATRMLLAVLVTVATVTTDVGFRVWYKLLCVS